MESPLAILLLCLIILNLSMCDLNCKQQEKLCLKFRKCKECLAAHDCCMWIFEPNTNLSRCMIEEDIPSDQKYLKNRAAAYENSINKEFANARVNIDEPAVQIKPQKIKVYLKKGQSINVTITYKSVRNYPLDLYYLMDLSYSMKVHIVQMTKLGKDLAKKLKEMTSTYKLGLGYFSDKVVMPYSIMHKNMDNPCRDINVTCQPAFDFQHQLNFTHDVDKFIELVSSIKYTADIDDMEGGLDALYQVISCQAELNWRKHSRKIIVFATDGLLHTAGDGLLAGITEINSKGCKLIQKEGYSIYNGLQYDYPSIGQVHSTLREHKIMVLFACNDIVHDYYKNVHDLMKDVTLIGRFEEDSKNVLTLVENAYTLLIKSVRFSHKVIEGAAEIKFFSTCNKNKGIYATSSCNNIEPEIEYVFNVEVTLNDFKDNKAVIKINEMNLEESVEIEVHYVGDCKCQDENEANSCEHGKYSCGVCICEKEWIGDNCNTKCDRDAGRFKNATYTSPTCFQRGEFDEENCVCVCDEEYMGPFCQYDQCKRNTRGEICSNHGHCINGVCSCDPRYTGEICDCATSNETCVAPHGTELCSGHGNCVCGQCKCVEDEGVKYRGQFCEGCTGCQNLCDLYKEDVIAFADGRPNKEKMEKYNITLTPELNETHGVLCLARYIQSDYSCEIKYTYKVEALVIIDYVSTCRKQIGLAMGISILITTVLGLIFLLVIWKCSVTIKDRKEYERYKQEIAKCSYHEENPIYRSPITHFRNPTNSSSFQQ